MKIIFFGSSKFAVPALKKLYASKHKILCVVTQPDRKKGRGLRMSGTPVKQTAQELKLDIYQPLSPENPTVIEFLKNLNADIFVVMAYGKILSKNILDIPKIFPLNLHASLLPKYRGAAPIHRALINGERETGVTIIRMNERMDAGDMLLQKKILIDKNDTFATLEGKLAEEGAKALLEFLEKLENNDINLIPQNEKEALPAPKLKKEDGLIDWSKPAEDIINLIRGCNPWPGAFTHYKGKMLKILAAEVTPDTAHQALTPPGTILNIVKEGMIISTGKNHLLIKELQLEGKRKMEVGEFTAGYKAKKGELLG